MNRNVRLVGVAVVLVVLVFSILRLVTEPFSRLKAATGLSPSRPTNGIPDSYYYDFDAEHNITHNNSSVSTAAPGDSLLIHRANATLVMLARNSDIDGAVKSVREVEDKFNKKFGYPWVFLNEEPFSNEFQRRVGNLVNSPTHFAQIPKEHWFQPDWIDEKKASESREKMVQNNIIYGGSVPFSSATSFFNNIAIIGVLSFTITMYEYEATIPTLWETVKGTCIQFFWSALEPDLDTSFTEFVKLYPQYVSPDNAMGFMSENNGENYNLCHFWSNFEIADMDFWRGEAYTKFFEFLDSKGGFYYERWGDAPVHSIATALFARKDQIQFFREIGYEHNPYTHCPKEEDLWERGRCACDPGRSFGAFVSPPLFARVADYDGYSCLNKWDRLMAA
ncbi:hypothetical protein EW146_g5055 [Bondarzewia mesenterica]|uniref:Glycosyltransferase family 15 protein n=1 Tax=Bondarzewia mesenterica TaxID=1095465 RepID=A0A4S4LSL9_9AGAM|nr:hypothetical protein EW146_g5055 [Bondarzewia mesenterica]